MIFKSFDLLRAAGFDNLNLDLMFGIPGQTMATWRSSLAEAIALGSEHLACYEVIYEEDTPLFAQLRAGKIRPMKTWPARCTTKLLAAADAAGLQQYEVANFARRDGGRGELPERACRHNVNYWRGGSFHGLGPSAAGYAGGRRATNVANTASYCEQLERASARWHPANNCRRWRGRGSWRLLDWRMTAGWPLAQFQQRTGFDLKLEWAPEIERIDRTGLWQARQ